MLCTLSVTRKMMDKFPQNTVRSSHFPSFIYLHSINVNKGTKGRQRNKGRKGNYALSNCIKYNMHLFICTLDARSHLCVINKSSYFIRFIRYFDLFFWPYLRIILLLPMNSMTELQVCLLLPVLFPISQRFQNAFSPSLRHRIRYFHFSDYYYCNLSQTISDYQGLSYYSCDVLVCVFVYIFKGYSPIQMLFSEFSVITQNNVLKNRLKILIQENNHNNKLCISATTLICCIINTQSASTFVVSLHLKLV